MPSKTRSYLIITRPINLVIGMMTIFIGAFVTGTIQPLIKVMLACASGTLIMASGNVVNDYFDVEVDRSNKPFRPIPSNQMEEAEALRFSIILFVLGNFLSIFIGGLAVFVAVLTTFGLFVYSAKLKRTVLFGNMSVSLFTALAFVYGGISVDRWQASLMPAGLAFFFHLGREIIKDVEDQAADKSAALVTLPVRFGQRAAFIVVTIIFGLLIVLTFIPYLLEIYGKGYFWTVLIGVDLVILASLIYMWMKPFPKSLRRISAILKADMVVGLTALLLCTAN